MVSTKSRLMTLAKSVRVSVRGTSEATDVAGIVPVTTLVPLVADDGAEVPPLSPPPLQDESARSRTPQNNPFIEFVLVANPVG
jgi:hypothetical protein